MHIYFSAHDTVFCFFFILLNTVVSKGINSFPRKHFEVFYISIYTIVSAVDHRKLIVSATLDRTIVCTCKLNEVGSYSTGSLNYLSTR